MRGLIKLVRTLHIYVSMFGLIILLFFSVTGFTLNHADWFASDEPAVREMSTTIPAALLKEPDKLAIVESLRRELKIPGLVEAFEIEEAQLTIDFKGPASISRVKIDRGNGKATAQITFAGTMALLNDLHMGRDSGAAWSWIIDITAWLMTFVSLSGMALLLTLPKRRNAGLIAMIVGTALCVAVYVWMVP